MVFQSRVFLLAFLPAALLLYHALRFKGHFAASAYWLIAASLVFYAGGVSDYLPLLVLSLGVNYALGRALQDCPEELSGRRQGLFALGLVFNLGLLGFYKYAGFLLSQINAAFGTSLSATTYLLPPGISFFTFTQLMYLIDAHAGLLASPYRFRTYAQFVVFFPTVVSGPITKHEEMVPQFESSEWRIPGNYVTASATLLVLGLFKKIIIADRLSAFVNPAFAQAAAGDPLSTFSAWTSALAYTFQLYFDFSGYSDMAIGIAGLFGIRVPFNFNSPFKAVNAIDFWQRWHMTLTRFLTSYIYNPLMLAISRKSGKSFLLQVACPLMLTMLAAGLWHGAGWTFIVFGGLHGAYLIVSHAFQQFRKSRGLTLTSVFVRRASQLLTFLAVVVSFVFFRAESVTAAVRHLQSMICLRCTAGESALLQSPALGWILLLLLVVWILPNSQEWLSPYLGAANEKRVPESQLPRALRWAPTWPWAVIMAAVFAYTVSRIPNVPTTFLYFQF